MKEQANLKTQWIDEVIQEPDEFSFWCRLKLSIKTALRVFNKLKAEKTQGQLHRLSVQRHSNIDEALERVIDTGFSLLPTNSDRLDLVNKKDDIVKSVELQAPLVFKITTKDGFTYWLFRDKSQKIYSPLTFCAASAVYRSFVHGDQRVPGDRYLPNEGGTIVEAGAYVGYKAVAFGRRVGKRGRVLAIELAKSNYEMLERNIAANNMDDYVESINCAVWEEDTELVLKGVSRMNHSVADVDEKKLPSLDKVAAKSLDTIIDEADLEHVDYLNLQLNGAEVEAIRGLVRCWPKVTYLNIITRFHQDGVLVVEAARELLEERGAHILVDSRCGHLYNLTAKLN